MLIMLMMMMMMFGRNGGDDVQQGKKMLMRRWSPSCLVVQTKFGKGLWSLLDPAPHCPYLSLHFSFVCSGISDDLRFVNAREKAGLVLNLLSRTRSNNTGALMIRIGFWGPRNSPKYHR